MKKIAATLIATMLFTSNSVYAEDYCYTKVVNLFSEASGYTYARLAVRDNYVMVCNMNATWKNVTPTLCATWITYLRSAVARKANMIIFYSEDVKCATLPTYVNAPAPGYIMLMD